MQLQKTTGPHPYPHKFDVSMSLTEFIERYQDAVQPGELLEEESCSVAGLIDLSCVCIILDGLSCVTALVDKNEFVYVMFSKFFWCLTEVTGN